MNIELRNRLLELLNYKDTTLKELTEDLHRANQQITGLLARLEPRFGQTFPSIEDEFVIYGDLYKVVETNRTLERFTLIKIQGAK